MQRNSVVILDLALAEFGLNQEQLGFEILNIVKKSFPAFKPFLQGIFDGLTEEELRIYEEHKRKRNERVFRKFEEIER